MQKQKKQLCVLLYRYYSILYDTQGVRKCMFKRFFIDVLGIRLLNTQNLLSLSTNKRSNNLNDYRDISAQLLVNTIKLRSLKSDERINEKGDGPYRGFGYLSLFSDPKYLATWSQRELLYFCNSQQDSRYKDYCNPNGAKHIKRI